MYFLYNIVSFTSFVSKYIFLQYCMDCFACFRALLASRFLKEKLNLIGKVGCALCVIGSTVIVIHSPEEQHVNTMQELAQKLIDPGKIPLLLLYM